MPDLHTRLVGQPVTLPREIAIDWGLLGPDDLPEPEPTPEERAFAILEPHLHAVLLYRPTG